MCQQGRTGAHVRAQNIRRQVGVPSVQFSPVNLSNFTPVLTARTICSPYNWRYTTATHTIRMRVSLRSLGWYHLAGAAGGAVMTLWSASQGGALVGGSLAFAAIPFALSAWAGRRLLADTPDARRIAVAVQVLQIPIVILPALVWKFVAGVIASATLTMTGLGLYVGAEATWFIGSGDLRGLPATLGINVAPLVIIVLLLRARVARENAPPDLTQASRPVV